MTFPRHVPALIVGAGPIGLACAISAQRRSIEHLVIDQGAIVDSITRYPIGMTFFTTPERLEIGGHPITCSGAKPTREEAMMYYRGVVRANALPVRTFTRLVGATRTNEGLQATVEHHGTTTTIGCDRLVVATGYFGQANALEVPGEALPHVRHWFDEAHLTAGLDVVIVGGKNSAVESALECFRAGARVTLVYRGDALRPSVKFWLRPDLENRVAAGEITLRLGTAVVSIDASFVTVRGADGATERLPADRVYALTGYAPDFALLGALGVACDPVTGRAALGPDTMETNVPGVYLAGSVAAGRKTGDVFIENGRFDGEKIFGDAAGRALAARRYAESPRPIGE